MSREQGIEMVATYDHVRPSDLDFWLNYVDRDEEWFWSIADSFRSPKVWVKDEKNNWVKQNIWSKAG